MMPIVNGLEETYGRDFAIVRVDMDTGRGKKMAREAGFIGQPTFIFYDTSGQEIRRLMGPQDPETMRLSIDGAMGL